MVLRANQLPSAAPQLMRCAGIYVPFFSLNQLVVPTRPSRHRGKCMVTVSGLRPAYLHGTSVVIY